MTYLHWETGLQSRQYLESDLLITLGVSKAINEDVY